MSCSGWLHPDQERKPPEKQKRVSLLERWPARAARGDRRRPRQKTTAAAAPQALAAQRSNWDPPSPAIPTPAAITGISYGEWKERRPKPGQSPPRERAVSSEAWPLSCPRTHSRAYRGFQRICLPRRPSRATSQAGKPKTPESKTAFCSQGFLWCGREDSNFHGSYPTATSTLRVYQFRHIRMIWLGEALSSLGSRG